MTISHLNRIIRSVCGDDEERVKRLEEVMGYFERLEEEVKRLPRPRVRELRPPLLENVENLEELRREAERIAGEDRQAADYLVRRVTYLEHGRHLERGWRGTRCPVCGSPATLLLYRPSQSGIYSGHVPHFRCVCGATWPGEDWRCPGCGAHGRGSFEVFLLAGWIEERKCRACGYALPVTELGFIDLQRLHLLLLLVTLSTT